jgi:phosphate:Na+ symporter
VRSSGATTVTAVGLVGAGLLTFPQALGILLGANIGTTFTGWIVAVIGFKLELGVLAQPLLMLGALMRLFGNQRQGRIGMALAGFSLLFIGVDVLRAALGGLGDVIAPDRFPGDTLAGRAQLVLIGIGLTLVTQSSSAGVAMSLAAVASGSVTLPQAAAMVIGMDIGTTSTALLAALGGSTGMRRTGLAHVIYNLLTGIMAYALLGPAMRLAQGVAEGDASLALVAFHSGFNILGVVLVLPFTGGFARLIERMVPERRTGSLRRLDPALLREPDVALDAAFATAADLASTTRRAVAGLLSEPQRSGGTAALGKATGALADYVEQVRTPAAGQSNLRHVALLHTTDHLVRLSRRCTQADAAAALMADPTLRRFARCLARMAARPAEKVPRTAAWARLHRLLVRTTETLRARTIASVADGTVDAEAVLLRLDGIRWLRRVGYHLWRISHHLDANRRNGPSG